MPDAPEHYLQSPNTYMNAMAPDLVQGTPAQPFQPDRMEQHACDILNSARLWNPDPSVAGLIPGSQQWAPKAHQEERPEHQYRRRLRWAVEWNDSYTNPINHEPAARKDSLKIYNEDNDEYKWKCLEVRDEVEYWVHHINFFGQLVYTKSATSPAATIAILKSSTKWFGVVNTSRLRISVLVASASRLLDPVVYYGKPEALAQLRGTALEDACIGQCDKFYSNNGWWQDDEYTEEEYIPRVDTLESVHYKEGEVVINGCTPGFPSRVEIITAGTREQVAIDKACRAAVQARIARGPAKSKLTSCCISYDHADDYPDAVVDVRTYFTQRPSGSSNSSGNTSDTGIMTAPSSASPSVDATFASPASPAPVMSSEELNRRLEEAFPSAEWDEDDYMEDRLNQASATPPTSATTPQSRDITDREEPQEQKATSTSPAHRRFTDRELFHQRLAAAGDRGPILSWAEDEEEVPAATPVAQQPTTAVMATKTIVRVLVQGAARQPLMITVTEMRSKHPAKTVYDLANLAFTGLLPNLRFGRVVVLELAIAEPPSATVPNMLPTVPTVASIYTSVHNGPPRQRLTEIFDDEEEIAGTVVHSDVAIRNTADATLISRVSAGDIVPEGKEQSVARNRSGSSRAPAPYPENSRPRSPPQKPLRRRVGLAVPRTIPATVVSAASPSPSLSLASLCRFVAEASASPTDSSYDQWPDFSGVPYYSPTSSVSGQASAGECDDELLQGRSKGWFKRGLDKVKGFFSRKI